MGAKRTQQFNWKNVRSLAPPPESGRAVNHQCRQSERQTRRRKSVARPCLRGPLFFVGLMNALVRCAIAAHRHRWWGTIMNSKAFTAWTRAGLDAWALGADASAVIALRLAKAASGNDGDGEEARLMIAEKMQAAWEMQLGLLTGRFGATPLARTQKTIRHYRRKVVANRQRLSR